MANYPLTFYLIYRGNSVKTKFWDIFVRFRLSKVALARFGLDTLKLAYEQHLNSVRLFSVDKPSYLPMPSLCFFSVVNSRPSDRVISPFITSSPGTSECVGPFIPPWSPRVSGSVRPRLRPRPPSPGQSSPCPLCPVPCPCALLCCLPCVLFGVCPCFPHSLFSCSLLGFFVFPAACPSQSCQRVVMSRVCFPKMLSAFNPPQLDIPKVTNFLFLPNVTCRYLDSLAFVARTSSVLGALVAMCSCALAFRFVSCSYGRFVPLGGTCRPGYLVDWECVEGCHACSYSRGTGCGVPYPANV